MFSFLVGTCTYAHAHTRHSKPKIKQSYEFHHRKANFFAE